MISTNRINLIVEQNKYFNYYENKKYLKKFNQLSNTEINISIIVKLTICFKETL